MGWAGVIRLRICDVGAAFETWGRGIAAHARYARRASVRFLSEASPLETMPLPPSLFGLILPSAGVVLEVSMARLLMQGAERLAVEGYICVVDDAYSPVGI